MLAEAPKPLSGDLLASRIYSPFAYPLPRRERVVPIVMAEAERLGGHFPVVWRRGHDGPELVVLRSLLDDGRGFAAGTAGMLGLLPLVLQAYPFLPPADGEGRRMIDAALPDEPTDAGASVTERDGRLSRGTELRLRALDLFAKDRPRTLRLARALEAASLFDPWPLVFDLGGGQRCEIHELLIVRQKAFDGPVLSSLVAEFGVAAARVFGVHRLSLFRAGALLSSAQGAVAQSAAA